MSVAAMLGSTAVEVDEGEEQLVDTSIASMLGDCAVPDDEVSVAESQVCIL